MDIIHFLPEHPWARTIQYFDCIDSTNTHLQSLAVKGAPAGTVIIAGSQTAGRGRLGRTFYSPAMSGIYMSVLLRPGCKPEQLMHLTCATAVAVCRAIEQVAGFCPQIKWVNDIVWQGKKLGGILTGLSVNPATGLVDFAIVGIGINCNDGVFPPQISEIATSLSSVTGKAVDRAALAAALVQQLEIMDRELITQQSRYMARYRENCVVIGKKVYLVRGEESREATVLDIDDLGALIVRLPDGTVEAVNSGEVSLRGKDRYL